MKNSLRSLACSKISRSKPPCQVAAPQIIFFAQSAQLHISQLLKATAHFVSLTLISCSATLRCADTDLAAPPFTKTLHTRRKRCA